MKKHRFLAKIGFFAYKSVAKGRGNPKSGKIQKLKKRKIDIFVTFDIPNSGFCDNPGTLVSPKSSKSSGPAKKVVLSRGKNFRKFCKIGDFRKNHRSDIFVTLVSPEPRILFDIGIFFPDFLFFGNFFS